VSSLAAPQDPATDAGVEPFFSTKGRAGLIDRSIWLIDRFSRFITLSTDVILRDDHRIPEGAGRW
jgi:hypothetical protein